MANIPPSFPPFLPPSHNRTCMWVVVTEEGGESLLRVVAGKRLAHVFNVPCWCSLVVGLRSMRIVDEVVRHVRPKLYSLSGPLYPFQDLVWVNVSGHSHLALFLVYIHRLHTYEGKGTTLVVMDFLSKTKMRKTFIWTLWRSGIAV